MSGTFQQLTQPNNNLPLITNSNALSTICAFPLAYYRKDLNSSERTAYRYEWVTFETIWAYNYTVSTLNGITLPKPYSPYQFQSKNEQLAYSNGQLSHIAYYSTAAITGQFNNISY